MEPEGLNELQSCIYSKIQKYHDSDTNLTKAYLEVIAAVDMEARNKSEFVSLYASPHFWQEQNEVQQYTWDDYTEASEEIEDKDLGLVRKINLN